MELKQVKQTLCRTRPTTAIQESLRQVVGIAALMNHWLTPLTLLTHYNNHRVNTTYSPCTHLGTHRTHSWRTIVTINTFYGLKNLEIIRCAFFMKMKSVATCFCFCISVRFELSESAGFPSWLGGRRPILLQLIPMTRPATSRDYTRGPVRHLAKVLWRSGTSERKNCLWKRNYYVFYPNCKCVVFFE